MGGGGGIRMILVNKVDKGMGVVSKENELPLSKGAYA